MLFGSPLRGGLKKAKPFSFRPRYYDEEKEERQERYNRIEAEINGKRSFTSGGNFNLRDKWQRNKKTSNFDKKSNVRLVFIAIILFALCYWMFYY